MDDYTILPVVTIIGQKRAAKFIEALKELVEEYDGYLEFDYDSDLIFEDE